MLRKSYRNDGLSKLTAANISGRVHSDTLGQQLMKLVSKSVNTEPIDFTNRCIFVVLRSNSEPPSLLAVDHQGYSATTWGRFRSAIRTSSCKCSEKVFRFFCGSIRDFR